MNMGNWSQVRHAGAVAVLECISQEHSAVQEGGNWKQRRLEAEEARAVISRAFSAYMRLLKMVLSFKYLGRALSAADDDWLAVIQNMAKVRMVWRIF